MTPEEKSRQLIDARLIQSGWVLQDLKSVNPTASLGVAVREYPTSSGPVDYALFVDGKTVGVVEAKKMSLGKTSPLWKLSPVVMRKALLITYHQTIISVLLMKRQVNLPVLPITPTSNTVPDQCFLFIDLKHCLH